MKNSRWKDYEAYLASEEWAKLRNMALDRARHRCQVCNSDVKLQVHHRVYDARWGEESTDDLTVLCQSCHMIFHKNESKIRKINKLEKKIDNMKKAETNRGRKKRMKADPHFAKTVYRSGPVRRFTAEEIAEWGIKGDINSPLNLPRK